MLETWDVAMIDPPWKQRQGSRSVIRPNQKGQFPYSTLSTIDIFHLLDANIFSAARLPHVVFLWTVEKFLQDAEQQMEIRDYKRHARLIWDKGNGIAPAFTIRFAHEYLLWYYKPTLLKVAHEKRGHYTSVITAPGRQHSRKPDRAYDLVAALYPTQQKIDVFSREAREGWSVWGNELAYFKGGK